MKNKIKVLIAGICLILSLGGCGLHWSYDTAIESIDNEYFKTKVLYDDGGGVFVIENELTGERFLCLAGTYGVTVTPIECVD